MKLGRGQVNRIDGPNTDFVFGQIRCHRKYVDQNVVFLVNHENYSQQHNGLISRNLILLL